MVFLVFLWFSFDFNHEDRANGPRLLRLDPGIRDGQSRRGRLFRQARLLHGERPWRECVMFGWQDGVDLYVYILETTKPGAA